MSQVCGESTFTLLLSFLLSCMGRPIRPSKLPFPISIGLVGQTWVSMKKSESLNAYLGLYSDSENKTRREEQHSKDMNTAPRPNVDTKLALLLLSYCESELEKTREVWGDMSKERPGAISGDVVNAALQFCLVMLHGMHLMPQTLKDRANGMVETINKTILEVVQFSDKAALKSGILTSVLRTICEALWAVIPDSNLAELPHEALFLSPIVCHLGTTLRSIGTESSGSDSGIGSGIDDLDLDFESQISQSNSKQTVSALRKALELEYNGASIDTSLRAFLIMLDSLWSGADNPHHEAIWTQDFIDYLISLSPETFLPDLLFYHRDLEFEPGSQRL